MSLAVRFHVEPPVPPTADLLAPEPVALAVTPPAELLALLQVATPAVLPPAIQPVMVTAMKDAEEVRR